MTKHSEKNETANGTKPVLPAVFLHKFKIMTQEQQVPLHLIHHFIRGYFDGDGSITDPLKVPISISLLGTKEFLESLIKTLEIKSKSSILKKNKKHLNNTFYISMSGNNARNLISYIYKDATIFLERKYDRYIKHIERINKNVKWRSDKTIYKI